MHVHLLYLTVKNIYGIYIENVFKRIEGRRDLIYKTHFLLFFILIFCNK